jgi:hypothetical protein
MACTLPKSITRRRNTAAVARKKRTGWWDRKFRRARGYSR